MKYMGSKARFVKELLPIMLEDKLYTSFVDLFCGSCQIIANVPYTYERIANDINPYLISMWEQMTKDGIDSFPSIIERDFYSDVRDSFNKKDERYSEAMKGFIGFHGSYNGRFFDGGYSGHRIETKLGTFRDYIGENIRHTNTYYENLKGVKFYKNDYREVDIPARSIIYCDIPYRGTKQYKYSKDFDYEAFYEWCRMMKSKGHKLFISEYNMPSDFIEVWRKETKVTINQSLTKDSCEKLFTL